MYVNTKCLKLYKENDNHDDDYIEIMVVSTVCMLKVFKHIPFNVTNCGEI